MQYLMDRFADRGPSLRPSTPELRAKVRGAATSLGGCELVDCRVLAGGPEGHGASARPRVGPGRRPKLRVGDEVVWPEG